VTDVIEAIPSEAPKKREKKKPVEQLVLADSKGPTTPLGLLEIALSNNAAIDVIERLAALQEKALYRDAEIQFNEAMNAAQSELGRIAPDLTNPQTRSKYASYAQLDRVIRPVYSRHGFSLSFDTGDAPQPEMVRVLCYVSHKAGHTRTYRTDMPADGKGAKGGDVMTKTHAHGAAMQYGMRYLLKYIFNIAVGDLDTDGNDSALDVDKVTANLQKITESSDLEKLKSNFKSAYEEADKVKDKHAMSAYIKAKNETYRRLVGPVAPSGEKVVENHSPTPSDAPKPITAQQWAKLHASAHERGITHEDIAAFYRRKFHVEHGNQLTPIQFKLVCDEVATWKGTATA